MLYMGLKPRLKRYVKRKIVLYYLPVERMTTYKEALKISMERYKELEEENRTLKDNVEFLHSCLDDRDKSIAIMQEENKKLKETIKDHQLYEEKLEHRIIELEELLHWE